MTAATNLRENSVLDALEDIGYKTSGTEEFLEEALRGGCNSSAFTNLVIYLVKGLCDFYNIEEGISPVQADGSSEYFLMELNGFLREYGCPHSQLLGGSPQERLQDRNSRLLLIDYLLAEFQAAQIYFTDQAPAQSSPRTEANIADNLKRMLICLSFPKPPATITPFQIFSKIEAKLKELLGRHPEAIGSPLLKAHLTSTQWDKVYSYNRKLTDEYNLRRDMLCKRLDVTIQSFLWSDRAKAQQDKVLETYQTSRQKLKPKALVSISQLLAARDSLLNVEKTSGNRKGVETPINKVVTGDVPDRGGRTGGMQAPPPDMPSFMKRQADTSAGREGGRGGRGGRVQGGWEGKRNKGRGKQVKGGQKQ